MLVQQATPIMNLVMAMVPVAVSAQIETFDNLHCKQQGSRRILHALTGLLTTGE